jgi:hypothetical protein
MRDDVAGPDGSVLSEGLGAWQPIATAPRDRDVWVAGLARVWRDSMAFQWQGQAGWQEHDKLAGWWTTSHDDRGEPLLVDARYWRELPELPDDLAELVESA